MAAEQAPLTYKRDTLIKILRERIEENQKARDDTAAKAAEKNKKKRDQLVELLDKHPSFLVWLASRATENFTGDVGSAAFAESVGNAYAAPDGAEVDAYEYDTELKRLVRIYENAEDTEVKVTVYDDVFRYL